MTGDEGTISGMCRKVLNAAIDRYATVDARSLGLFRICLGALLVYDVARRFPDVADFYSDVGFLPSRAVLDSPPSTHFFSLHLLFESPGDVRALFVVQLLVDALLLVGCLTKIAHVLAALLLVSLNSRNVVLENGGWIVLSLLTIWTLFLPLGRRFSVDGVIRDRRRRRTPDAAAAPPRSGGDTVRSLAVTALIAQWTVIYVFNVVHKTAPAWKDGTAVYYFLQQDRLITRFGAWVRGGLSIDIVRLMSWGALAIEALIPVLLVTPIATRRAQMAAFALALLLHGSIGVMVDIGPFSWAMIAMFVVLVPAGFWDRAAAVLKRRSSPAARLFGGAIARHRADDPEEGFDVEARDAPPVFARWHRARRMLAEGSVAVLMVAVASQVVLDNRAIPISLKRFAARRPEWMRALVLYPRLYQRWSMFAPGPPPFDGRLVVDGRTVDGRRYDPLMDDEPSWEMSPPEGFGMNQMWGDFHARIGDPKRHALMKNVRSYLLGHHESTGRPHDQLVAFDLWFVTEPIPPPGESRGPLTRRKMTGYGVVPDPLPFPESGDHAP